MAYLVALIAFLSTLAGGIFLMCRGFFCTGCFLVVIAACTMPVASTEYPKNTEE